MWSTRVFLISFAVTFSLLLGAVADAQEALPPAQQTEQLSGLWLTTPYPAIEKPISDKIDIALDLENRALPPQRVTLSVNGLPAGWQWQIKGAGQAVGAAIVEPDKSVSLSLDITPAKDAKPGKYDFTIAGATDTGTLSLPVTLNLAEGAGAKVTLDPKLPALRGTPHSTFDFDLSAKNDSPDDQLFNLVAEAPPGFQAVFKEQYGTQELTSIPIKAGESKDIKLSVTPPAAVAAGQYGVNVGVISPAASAQSQLVLDITGQPTLALSGPEGRLSGDATAGKERTFSFTVQNSGTAPANNVKMSATAPSGWKVVFNPDKFDAIPPGQQSDVAVSMTPAEKAIAGDYVVAVRADGDGASDDASFRVTVLTSTVWGIAGLGVIGAAAIVLAVAVTRYGRR